MSAQDPRNPYRPGVGVKPLTLAGRDAELRRFDSALNGSPEIPANMRLTGLRGVGKSVLLAEMGSRAADAGWLVINLELEPRHNAEQAMLDLLVPRLRLEIEKLSRLKRATSIAKTVIESAGKVEVKVEDLTFGLDPTVPAGALDLARTLKECTLAATKRHRKGLAVLLDEAQVLSDETTKLVDCPLSMLLAAVTAIQRSQLPLAFALCGLPTLPTNLLKARSYTERMFRGEEIASLRPPADREAFVGPLQGTGMAAEPDLIDKVLRDVDGYPYFIQLWGAELWEAARAEKVRRFTMSLLRAVQPDIYERLDRDFYRPRFDAVTPAEQDLLLAAATCPHPPLRVADLNRASSKTTNNVNVLLGRLVTQGLMYRVRKGEYEYTAPQFHEFLQRHRLRLASRASGVAKAQTFTAISEPGYSTRTGAASVNGSETDK